MDDDVITYTYKPKLLNLVNWDTKTDRTQTNKFTSNSITLEQPFIKNEISPVDDDSQLPTSHDKAPRSRTCSV